MKVSAQIKPVRAHSSQSCTLSRLIRRAASPMFTSARAKTEATFMVSGCWTLAATTLSMRLGIASLIKVQLGSTLKCPKARRSSASMALTMGTTSGHSASSTGSQIQMPRHISGRVSSIHRTNDSYNSLAIEKCFQEKYFHETGKQ